MHVNKDECMCLVRENYWVFSDEKVDVESWNSNIP